MTSSDYLRILVENIHSAVVATVDKEGKPITRVIDIMLHDEKGIYFLTARGKAFYQQLMEQKYLSLSAVKGKKAVSLKGWVRNIGKEKLEEIFETNPYMKDLYPEGKRDPLEVFCLYEGEGEFFDISNPKHIERGQILIGNPNATTSGYFISTACKGCGLCASICPQNCIDTSKVPSVIKQDNCLFCGGCAEVCPEKAITRR